MSDLDALEPWLAGVMARVSPSRRMMLARRVGMIMRRYNAARVKANVEPDGTKMAARNPRKGKRKQDKGRMFRRIELARNMTIRPGADQVELRFKGRVANAAEVHHYGLEDAVDRRVRNSIRVRYRARRLLGFGPGDRDAMLGEIMSWLDGS